MNIQVENNHEAIGLPKNHWIQILIIGGMLLFIYTIDIPCLHNNMIDYPVDTDAYMYRPVAGVGVSGGGGCRTTPPPPVLRLLYQAVIGENMPHYDLLTIHGDWS